MGEAEGAVGGGEGAYCEDEGLAGMVRGGGGAGRSGEGCGGPWQYIVVQAGGTEEEGVGAAEEEEGPACESLVCDIVCCGERMEVGSARSSVRSATAVV